MHETEKDDMMSTFTYIYFLLDGVKVVVIKLNNLIPKMHYVTHFSGVKVAATIKLNNLNPKMHQVTHFGGDIM